MTATFYTEWAASPSWTWTVTPTGWTYPLISGGGGSSGTLPPDTISSSLYSPSVLAGGETSTSNVIYDRDPTTGDSAFFGRFDRCLQAHAYGNSAFGGNMHALYDPPFTCPLVAGDPFAYVGASSWGWSGENTTLPGFVGTPDYRLAYSYAIGALRVRAPRGVDIANWAGAYEWPDQPLPGTYVDMQFQDPYGYTVDRASLTDSMIPVTNIALTTHGDLTSGGGFGEGFYGGRWESDSDPMYGKIPPGGGGFTTISGLTWGVGDNLSFVINPPARSDNTYHYTFAVVPKKNPITDVVPILNGDAYMDGRYFYTSVEISLSVQLPPHRWVMLEPPPGPNLAGGPTDGRLHFAPTRSTR